MNPGSPRCLVRKVPDSENSWTFDFDRASPGGEGGAGIWLDLSIGLASIAAVVANLQLPSRSTGGLIAEGLQLTPLTRPTILEAFSVEATTREALRRGGEGPGTLLGNLLEDLAVALSGTIIRWEPIAEGKYYHLRVHLTYDEEFKS